MRELLGSVWRDEYGNEYRVHSIHHTDDPEIGLAYVPPKNRKLHLGDLERSWTQVAAGYPSPPVKERPDA